MGPLAPLGGALLVVAVVAALVVAARPLARALLPEATRALAALVVVIIATATFLLAAQLVGLVGLLQRGPLTVVVVALALAELWLAGRLARRERAPVEGLVVPEVEEHPLLRVGAWVPVVAAVAQWVTATASTLRTGFLDDDSIAYHLPFAARFAQQHDITQIQFIAPDQPISFYPENSELLHASLLTLVGNDLLSPFVNLLVLGGLILAAWCFGERFGRSHLCVAVVGMVAASPLYTSHFPGSALVDVFGITMFCAAVVVLLRTSFRIESLAVAGAAAGIALGTKFTLVGPVGLLTVAVLVLCGRRWRLSATWLAGLVAFGSVWYLRNLLHVGNPVPPARLGLGPLVFEKTDFAISEYSHSVASYLTDSDAVRDVYEPGITSAYGRWWPVVLALVVLGGVGAAVAGRDRVHRAVGLVAVGSLLAYLLTPGAALGFGPLPDLVYFSSAVRYGGPATFLGLLLVPTVPLLDRRWARRALVVLAIAVVIGAHRTAAPLWWVWRPGATRLPGLVAASVVAVAVVGWMLGTAMTRRRWLGLAAIGGLCALLLLGVANERWSHRYRHGGDDMARLHAWAQDVHDARIATAGFFQVYPLHGSDVSNHVQNIGEEGPRGSFTVVGDCETWVEELADGGYDYVVVAPYDLGRPAPDEVAWTASIPSATLAFEAGKVKVFRFTGPVQGGCEGQASASG